MNQYKLRGRIMRRIYAIWLIRRVLPFSLGAIACTFFALRYTAQSFFVAKVVDNFFAVANTNALSVPQFLTAAIANTNLAAILMIGVFSIAALSLGIRLYIDIRTVAFGARQLQPQQQRH